MKVVYHPRFEEVYSSDPAAKAGRMESITREVSPHFEMVMTEPATADNLRLVHSDQHIEDIKSMGLTYEVALLAAGGTIKAAELATNGNLPLHSSGRRDTTPALTIAGDFASSIIWRYPSPV